MKKCIEAPKASVLRALRKSTVCLPFNIEQVIKSQDEQNLTTSYCAYGWNSIVFGRTNKSPSSQKWISKKNKPNSSPG